MQPFVILANQRSGSSVLRYALNEQPGVVSHGELLREGAHAKVSHAARTASGWRRLEARVFPERSLRRYLRELWAPRPDAHAVGFKLMYDQAAPRVQRLLASWPELHIVHLVRANALKALVSYEVARAHETFTVRPGEAFGFEPVRLDPESVLPRLRDHLERVERHRAWSVQWPRFELTYEELSADPRATIGRVLSFLGIPGEARGELPLRKMTPDALDEALTNAEEIRAVLRGTEFAALLDEERLP